MGTLYWVSLLRLSDFCEAVLVSTSSFELSFLVFNDFHEAIFHIPSST